MSVHSPVASISGVRIPKLKVRNRPPDHTSEGAFSHSTQPSTGTYRPESSDSDTGIPSVPQSPYSFTHTSPISPASPDSTPKIAVRHRPDWTDSAAETFTFPHTSSKPATEERSKWSQGQADDIQPVSSPIHASTTDPQPRNVYDAAPETHELSERHLVSLDRAAGKRWSEKSPVNTSSKTKSGLGGLFGHFSLKEPSAAALEHYAHSQRKQAEYKGVRNAALGLPGVTDRKLPSDAPKVNSKWDGLPDWASEAVKEAKKGDRGKSDVLLHKMAEHRRPNSQHDSVSTFDSGLSNSAGSRSGDPGSKTRQRPESRRSPSKSSSVQRVRNPSHGRGLPRKKSSNIRRSQDPDSWRATAVNISGVASPPNAGVPFHNAFDILGPNATTQHGTRTPRGHNRTISDPRLNYGMDNVASITAFLGDEDVSVGRILPKRAPEAGNEDSKRSATDGSTLLFSGTVVSPNPPPSQLDIGDMDSPLCLDRSSTSGTNDSWQTAEQALSIPAFPSPPASPSPNPPAHQAPAEEGLEDVDVTPKGKAKPQVRVIVPGATSAQRVTAVPPQHGRARSPRLAVPPQLSSHNVITSQSGLMGNSTEEPKTIQRDANDATQSTATASSATAGERGKKKTRWSALGRKSRK